MNQQIERLNSLYNRVLDSPAPLHGGSGFWNFGYWTRKTKTHKMASENLMERLLSFLPAKEGTILDVACGAGQTTQFLTNYYAPRDVTAIDINERQLQEGRRRAPGCAFLYMDATQLTFSDAAFSNVICVEAACHFNTRERFLKEAVRVLKPGGRLILAELILPQWTPLQPPQNYVHSLDDYKAICYAAGFDDVMTTDVSYECSVGFSDYAINQIERMLNQGEISMPAYRAQLLWVQRSRDYPYLLVCCRKAET